MDLSLGCCCDRTSIIHVQLKSARQARTYCLCVAAQAAYATTQREEKRPSTRLCQTINTSQWRNLRQ
jgi:hypothetical protein